MKKAFFYLLIIIIWNSTVLASEKLPYVDSLLSVLEKEDDPYTQIKLNGELCFIQRSRAPQEAIEYGSAALKVLNQYPQYDTLKSEVLNYMGVVYRNKGDYSAAISYYLEALRIAEEYNLTHQIAYSNNNLGGLFTLKGEYESAIEYLEKALFYFNLANDKKGMGYVCVNLGNLYRHNNDFDEAISYFDQAKQYKEKCHDTIGIAIATNLKAISYYESNNFDKAAELYQQLQGMYKRNKDIKGLAVVKNYLGLIEVSNSNHKKAIKYFEEALNLNNKVEYKQGQATSLLRLGKSYHQIGNTQKAFECLKDGLAFAKEIGDTEALIIAYNNYAEIYEDLGNFQKALEYKDKYIEEVVKREDFYAREKLAALRINNELDKRASINTQLGIQNKALNDDLEKQIDVLWIYRYFIIACLVLIIVLIVTIVFLRRKNNHKVSRNTELVIINEELKESNKVRDRFLSIIGHDLKNPFNSVLGLTSLLVEEWETIPDAEKLMIVNEINSTGSTLFELMDNLLLWAKNQNQALKLYQNEFNLNDTIIDVYELFRNEASFKEIKLELNVGKENFVFADENMINTVVRNLVSNAIKFTRKNGKIKIDIIPRTYEIELNITDNGKGILPEDLKRILEETDSNAKSTKGTANETGTGLGLLLVKDFVKQNNGIFWVDSKPGVGSRFCFTLPVSKARIPR